MLFLLFSFIALLTYYHWAFRKQSARYNIFFLIKAAFIMQNRDDADIGNTVFIHSCLLVSAWSPLNFCSIHTFSSQIYCTLLGEKCNNIGADFFWYTPNNKNGLWRRTQNIIKKYREKHVVSYVTTAYAVAKEASTFHPVLFLSLNRHFFGLTREYSIMICFYNRFCVPDEYQHIER